jgi:hypothetical protein
MECHDARRLVVRRRFALALAGACWAACLAVPSRVGAQTPADAGRGLDARESAPVAAPVRPATWKGALRDSFRLLLIEHGTRMFQEKTRRELGGPFFADYVHALRVPRSWEDGDNWMINYLGHPVHGAAASRIWLDHDAADDSVRFGMSKAYWGSRGIATAWAAGYSAQFEFGPLSEASIGNVGRDPRTTGWVDHVVTPAGSFAITVAEDALDRYFVELVERHTRNRTYRAIIRVLFNPGRSMANVAEGRTPWFRRDRSLR